MQRVACKIPGGQWRYVQNLPLHQAVILTALFKDLGLRERIQVKELHQLVCNDPTYQNLTMEEEDKTKQDVLELCEQKCKGNC